MTEEDYRTWELRLKVAGTIGLAIGGLFTAWQYFDNARQQRETAQLEAQKPFLAQRQELYGEAVRTVATLAVSDVPADIKKATTDFWRLYWGPLASVESADVETLMVKAGRCVEPNTCPEDSLKSISLQLARVVRHESQVWNVSLPPLQDRP